MNIREQLITVLQDKYIGIGAIPNVAEAIAAHARFNIWFLTFAKKNANETQMNELLERSDRITELCSAVVSRFKDDHDGASLMAGVDEVTKQLTDAMRLA